MITANPGESFLDRMIQLVEGAERQKTPNEIALTILLSALTIIFLVVVMTLKFFGIYSGVSFSVTVLVALLVCLIPTTIGGLLSAIGIAGIDRLVQKNVLAMSGRAVEAAGDVERPAPRQDGDDHAGRPAGDGVPAGEGRDASRNWRTPPSSPRWPTRRRKAAASSSWRNSTASGGGTSRRCPTPISSPSRRRRG